MWGRGAPALSGARPGAAFVRGVCALRLRCQSQVTVRWNGCEPGLSFRAELLAGLSAVQDSMRLVGYRSCSTVTMGRYFCQPCESLSTYLSTRHWFSFIGASLLLEHGLFLVQCGSGLALPGGSDDTDSGSGKHHRRLVWTLTVHPHPDGLFLPAPLQHRAHLGVLLRARVADSHPDTLIELSYVEQ